jgi:hydrogenase expression/formation protein HypC
MCLGIPGRIVSFDADNADLALVEVSGVRRRVNIGILERSELHEGDWVLVHVGFAMSKMDEAAAASALEFLRELGEAWDEELRAFERSEIE